MILRTILFCFFTLWSITLLAKVKNVKVTNGSDEDVSVYISLAEREGEFGAEISSLVKIRAGRSKIIELSIAPTLFSYINLVVVRGKGSQRQEILVSSYFNEKESPKTQPFNFTGLDQKAVDQPEIEKFYNIISKAKKDFSDNNLVINREYEAGVGFDEYLGAIVIVDIDPSPAQNHRLKRIYRARQLGINNPPVYRGKDYKESIRLSQSFAIGGNAQLPAAFDVQMDFNSAQLFEFNYKIFGLGPVEAQTTENKTAVDILFELDANSRSEIIETIAQILVDCPTCSVRRIERVLAFKGGVVTVKRYQETNKVWTGSGFNVVTNNGNFSYMNGFDYDQYIPSAILALGISEEQLETEILLSASREIEAQIYAKEDELNNSKVRISRLQSDIYNLKTLKASFDSILNPRP